MNRPLRICMLFVHMPLTWLYACSDAINPPTHGRARLLSAATAHAASQQTLLVRAPASARAVSAAPVRARVCACVHECACACLKHEVPVQIFVTLREKHIHFFPRIGDVQNSASLEYTCSFKYAVQVFVFFCSLHGRCLPDPDSRLQVSLMEH